MPGITRKCTHSNEREDALRLTGVEPFGLYGEAKRNLRPGGFLRLACRKVDCTSAEWLDSFARLWLRAFVLLLICCLGVVVPTAADAAQSSGPGSYFDSSGRDDQLTGGVKLIS